MAFRAKEKVGSHLNTCDRDGEAFNDEKETGRNELLVTSPLEHGLSAAASVQTDVLLSERDISGGALSEVLHNETGAERAAS